MENLSTMYDVLNQNNTMLTGKVQNVEKELKQLRSENLHLKTESQKLCDCISKIDKYSYASNLIIRNVPEKQNENLIEIIHKIAQFRKISFNDHEIDTVHRLGSNNGNNNRKGSRPILCKFTTKRLKELLTNKKQINEEIMTTRTCKIFNEDHKIVLHDHMPPKIAELFQDARNVKDTLQFKYLWYKHGEIHMRENDSSAIIVIKSIEDLNKLN